MTTHVDDLVAAHLDYAATLAGRYRGRGVPRDDLEQVARLGLVKAAQRFDPQRGVPFRGFAKPTIEGELRRHFRDKGWGARVPRPVKDLAVRLGRATDQLESSLGRAPTPVELAEHLDVHTDDVLTALEARQAYRPASIDAPRAGAAGDGATTVGAGLAQSAPGPEETATDRLVVEQLLADLSERDATIVRLRFFENMTQSEIAEQVGLSQMQISRLLRSSLTRMRELSRQTGRV